MEILCNLSRPIACCLLWVQPSPATNHLLPPWLLGFVWRSQTVAGKDNGSFTSQQVSFPIPSPFPAIGFCMALVSLSFAFPWCQKALRVSATVACSFSSASPFTQDWSIWSIDNIDISIRETALVMASAIWWYMMHMAACITAWITACVLEILEASLYMALGLVNACCFLLYLLWGLQTRRFWAEFLFLPAQSMHHGSKSWT